MIWDLVLVAIGMVSGYLACWVPRALHKWYYRPKHLAVEFDDLSDKERKDIKRIEGMLDDKPPREFPLEPSVTVYPDNKPTTFTGPSIRNWREWLTWHFGETWRTIIEYQQSGGDRLVPVPREVVVRQPAGSEGRSEGARRAQERLPLRSA